jgi:DNA (cytosine-5)-methyltransferase 1
VTAIPTLVSLFCGCGGLDLGFLDAGFETVYAVDSSPAAARIYELNLPCKVDVRDIRDVRSFPPADVLAAGFPCQPFSSAGSMDAGSHPLGCLYREALRAVEVSRPHVVLFENVPGILSACLPDGTLAADAVRMGMGDLGYEVAVGVLDAWHYGVPQRRRRVFFLGSRGSAPSFPPPWRRVPARSQLLGAVLDPPSWVPDRELARVGLVDAGLIPLIPEGGCWKDVPDGLLPERLRRYRAGPDRSAAIYRRRKRTELCGTITASFRPAMAGIIHPTEDRLFSVREAARIQSFPDWFRFPSRTPRDTASMFRCIGNAVPPRLAEALALWIRETP